MFWSYYLIAFYKKFCNNLVIQKYLTHNFQFRHHFAGQLDTINSQKRKKNVRCHHFELMIFLPYEKSFHMGEKKLQNY